ncbi:MAG: PadR family transcriptional regulator, partial [Asticcacaulis sp.]
EKPSHGYELIKAIEDRFNGAYSPSPGVIYPTLSWLEDEGFITITAGEDGRKSAQITEAGQAHLAEKTEAIDELFNLMDGRGSEQGDYGPIFRAMGNLKASLKTRGMKAMNKTEIEAVVDMIDDLAKKIERL